VKEMTIYVCLDIFQGVVNDIQVFLSEKSALKIDQEWLKKHEVKGEVDRECKAQNGTELIIHDCKLRL